MEELEFNVSHLLREPIGAKHAFEYGTERKWQIDSATVDSVVGHTVLIHTNFGILAEARFTALVEVECDRCLTAFSAEVSSRFAEEYLPVVDISTGRPVQSERTEDTFAVSANHIVDLTEAVRQHLLLAMPMHRLCREDCKGLCLNCGADRNIEDCGCLQEVVDEPMAVLAEMLTKGWEK